MSTLTPGPTRLETGIWSTYHKKSCWKEITSAGIVIAVVGGLLTLHLPSAKWAGASKWVPLNWEVDIQLPILNLETLPVFCLWEVPTLVPETPLTFTHSVTKNLHRWANVLVLNSHLGNGKGIVGGPSYCRLPHGMGEVHHSLRMKRQTTNLPSWQRNIVAFLIENSKKSDIKLPSYL